MKMKYLSILALSLALTFSACGESKKEEKAVTEQSTEKAEEKAAETVEKEAKSSYPITVTDQIGREVTIEQEAKKIVSGYYISTSTLIGLDLEDRLVGVEAKAAEREIYEKSAPDLLAMPQVGSLKAFDLEACIALKPDLVILAAKQKDSIKALEDLGIKVLVVNPETGEKMTEMIDLLGKVSGKEERAKELLSFIKEKEADVTSLVASEEKPSVYLAGNANFLETAGAKMYQSSLIETAGGSNVAAEIADTYWAGISYEQFLSWNPQYIILASDATYTVEDVLNDPNLVNADAVKNKNVYQMPKDTEAWDSPVPSSVLGSVWLSGILHGDKVEKESYLEVANEYYEKFYGFTYSQN